MEPLIETAIEGNSLRVRELLQQGTHPDSRDLYGETALTWAAHLGHTAVVKDMLAAGADREALGNFLRATPLLLAAQGGHRGIVALLSVFANLDARDHRGATALMLSVEQSEGAIKPQRRVLKMIKILIDAGADINLQDYEGRTALMWAIQWKNKDAVKLLLSAGANPHLKDDAGHSALNIADVHGHKEIVSMLQRAGALE